MTLPAPRRECIFGDVCVVGPTSPHSRLSPLGRAGLKSGLIKFLVRCERENKMGQRVKYCTGLHFASGERVVAKREGEKREPGRAGEFYEKKEARRRFIGYLFSLDWSYFSLVLIT